MGASAVRTRTDEGPPTVRGTVAPGFEQVRAAFAAAHRHDAGGAQLAVHHDGRPVVDLWTGADPLRGQAFTGDSIGVVMSVTKGVVATCAHLLSERGELDLDAPVSAHWPEFAVRGKERITTADLLSHTAGLSGFDPAVGLGAAALPDWEACTGALAAAAPFWRPGTAVLYHTLTYGYLVGEVIRRATGRTVGQVLAAEAAGPLGLDLWIGLPQRQEPRYIPAFLHPPRTGAPEPAAPGSAASGSSPAEQARALLDRLGIDPDAPLVRSTVAAALDVHAAVDLFNRREGQAAEIPAANGIANASSLARLYAALLAPVDGVRLLDGATLARAVRPRTDHLPAPTPFDRLPAAGRSRFGLGYELPRPGLPMLGHGSFGHAGAGGRLAFAQPRTGTAVGYLCTHMAWDPAAGADPRWQPWTEALADAVGADLTDVR